MKIGDLIWLGQQLADAGRGEIRASAPDVPTAELIVMGDLLDSSPSTITAIADRTGYARSRVSTAVAAIVERGWAQTGSDPADGRRTVVFVPDDVRATARTYQEEGEARAFDHLLVALPPDRRESVRAALEELLAALRRVVEVQPGAEVALDLGPESEKEALPPPRHPRGRRRARR